MKSPHAHGHRVSFLLTLILLLLFPSSANAETLYPYIDTFRISAYYSPCPDQSHYATGTYEGDIRLNGRGVSSADGTPVYPGMIAAPSKYPFGTKMSIPGIGIVAVHDRGGAIVQAGERSQAYDRIDVWMGTCDEGLRRALTWGVRNVENVTVFGFDDSVEESVYLEGFSAAEVVVKHVVLAPQIFPQDIWYLSTGEDVEKLQYYLAELGYYTGPMNGTYGDETREAVFHFQQDESIVDDENDWGAGHAGVNTRKALDLAIARLKEEQEQRAQDREALGQTLLSKYPDLPQSLFNFYRDLQLGMTGEDVRQLQNELVQLGYLRIDPTGYYGQVTQHAILKLQQKWGLIDELNSSGAGRLGPQTRSRLNALLDDRFAQMSTIAVIRDERENNGVKSVIASSKSDGVFASDLSFGERGVSVQQLQGLLKDLGFFKGLFVTEFYGNQTRAAVYAFQLANGLVESTEDVHAGQLNASTRDILNALI